MIERQAPASISKSPRGERREALAKTCNALSVALFVSAELQPLMAGHPSLSAAIAVGAVIIALPAFLH